MSIERFRKEQEITKFAEKTKMVVVFIMVLSVAAFTVIGEKDIKPYILYWAAVMLSLVALCAVQDFINKRKIERL